MVDKMRLEVILSAVDKATGPLKGIAKGSKDTAAALEEARRALGKMEAEQRKIARLQDRLNSAKKGAASERDALRAAQANLEVLKTTGGATERQIARQQASVDKQRAAYERQRNVALRLRAELNNMGVGKAAVEQAQLAARIATANAQIDAQRRKLEQQIHVEQRLHALRDKHGSDMARLGMRGATAAGVMYAGQRMAHGMVGIMAEGKHSANEELRIGALGLGADATADAVKFAKGMKTYGTSMKENLGLMRDAITVFSDVHHAQLVTPLLAKMKFANEAVFGAADAGENEAKFMDMLKVIELRGGLVNQAAFEKQANIVQQVLTATGGRVGPTEWLNMIKTGGVAAKGITDEAFYFQMEPLVQEMGGNRVGTALMSAYQNIYQGKTTKRAALLMDQLGLIADPSKVKHDKVGQISQLGIGAIKGADIFRTNQFEWMEQVLLPTLAEKGITEKQDVMDAIGGIFSNRTASGLFAQMYLQRDQVHKSAALNARADNVDTLYGKAKGSAAGAEIDLLKRRDDLYNEISTAVMPAYVQALEVAASAVKGLTRIMQEHPMATKMLGIGFGALAVILTGAGGLGVALVSVLGPLAIARFLAARFGLGLLAAKVGVQGAAVGFGVLGRAVGGLWRMLTRFPLVTIALGIATALHSISQKWDAITAAWKAGDGHTIALSVLEAFVDGVDAMFLCLPSAIAKIITGLWDLLTGAGWEIGKALVGGVIDAIEGMLNGLTAGLYATAKEKLGKAWDYVKGGDEEAPQARTARTAAAAAAMAAAVPLAAGAAGIDTYQPMVQPVAPVQMAPRAAAAPAVNTTHNNITIHAAPGMDEKAVGRAVTFEMDRRERAKRSRVLSQLSDID
jgi:hypothetical protein